MDSVKFEFDRIEHEYPLSEAERVAFRIPPRTEVCKWAEENITLVRPAYTYPGPFKPYPWQREPINAYNHWRNIVLVGAVQTFKSGITDLYIYYSIAVLGLNGMVAYSNTEKSTDAFEDRYCRMIKSEENPVLRETWNGKEDMLSKNKMKLIPCTWKVASAQNPNDLASFSAPITVGSEVAKWVKKIGKFDSTTLLRGRSDAALAMGDAVKSVLESSPYEVGDSLYKEVFREGTLILRAHYKCPHCGVWQVLTDKQIKLKMPELKGRPAKIRQYKEEAVRYDCISCGKEITEADRARMSEGVIWAAPEIKEEGFTQRAEIINRDGTVVGRRGNGVRPGYDQVCYWWSRLEDMPFTFYECLARFFSSVNDLEKLKSYENETMARWQKVKTGKVDKNFLMTKRGKYDQWGDGHYVPDDVLLITLGVDTQDNGFYYCYCGWGRYLSCRILRCGFIECPMFGSGFENQVFKIVVDKLNVQPLMYQDGVIVEPILSICDRGGHRSADVDYLCKHFPSGKMVPYIGSTRVDPKKPMVYHSAKDKHYMGQTPSLSEVTGKYLCREDFTIPADIEEEYVDQLLSQWHQKKIKSDGTTEVVWVHEEESDHMRDCFNYAYAALLIKKADKLLVNAQYFGSLECLKDTITDIKEQQEVKKQVQKQQIVVNNDRNNVRDIGRRGYFGDFRRR